MVFQEVMYEGPTKRWVVDGDIATYRKPDSDGTRELYDLTNDPGEATHDCKASDSPMKSVCAIWVVGVDGRRRGAADFAELVGRNLSKQLLPAPIRTSGRIGKYLELIGIDADKESAARRPFGGCGAALRRANSCRLRCLSI